MSDFHTKASKVTETIDNPTEVALVHLEIDIATACILRRVMAGITGEGPIRAAGERLQAALYDLAIKAPHTGTIVDYMRVR